MRAWVVLMLALLTLAGCSRRATTATDPDGGVMEAGTPTASASAELAPGAVAPPGPMVLLKGGRFRMGSDSVGTLGEGPAHFVRLPAFRLDMTEVTVAEYRACVRAGACTRPAAQDADHHASIWDAADVDAFPISSVTWYQARDYCAWAGKELPTEEQWEYACGGAVGRDFPWGWGVPGHDWGLPDDAFERVVGACVDQTRGMRWQATCPVGLAPRSATPEGVQDLAGNAREWMANIVCPYDKSTCTETARAVRGGIDNEVFGGASALRCVARGGHEPTYVDARIGFRCAQRVEEAKP